jgi:chromosome segregation ATPase
MADGRKVQYLIELMPDTKQFEKIRQKIKAIDGGEFIKFEPSEVKKLKGILQGVVDDVGNRASSIGTKIQQGIASGIDKDKLQKMLDLDTTKLRETMEIVEKLTGLIDDHSKGSSWLKDGKGFLGKLSGAQQDLTNLEKSISQLELKFEGLDASLTSTITKLDALATTIRSLQDNGKPIVVSPINVTTGTKQVQQFEK